MFTPLFVDSAQALWASIRLRLKQDVQTALSQTELCVCVRVCVILFALKQFMNVCFKTVFVFPGATL